MTKSVNGGMSDSAVCRIVIQGCVQVCTVAYPARPTSACAVCKHFIPRYYRKGRRYSRASWDTPASLPSPRFPLSSAPLARAGDRFVACPKCRGDNPQPTRYIIARVFPIPCFLSSAYMFTIYSRNCCFSIGERRESIARDHEKEIYQSVLKILGSHATHPLTIANHH